MATAVEKLMYKIGLVDQMSEPAKRVEKAISGMQKRARAGFRQIAVGAAGLAGAGYTAVKLTQPAVAMRKAMGEVASLGVPDEELATLERTATRFALRYGGNAAEIVASSYDIQSAISGLVDGELAAFANASALLAKATKADAATITSYMGTMYGVFKDSADAMGRARWVDQLTGQTATAVRMFKTTGPEMAAAFVGVGAAAKDMGVGMGEQLAILGKLQTTMSGAEAGTRYVSFLQGAGRAQKALGLRFTDSQGRMLPTVEILERIRGKFGAIDTLAKQDLLKAAFGRKEAVAFVQALLADTAGLAANIAEIEGIPGLGPAEAMAAKMADSTERLAAGMQTLYRIIGATVLNALDPFIDRANRAFGRTIAWLEANPRLARTIGIAIVATLGLVAALGALTVAMGVINIISAGVLAVKAIVIAVKAWQAAQWALNIAMLANPVGLVIAGIVLFIAVIAGAVFAIRKGTKWMKILGYVALVSLGPIGIAIAILVTYWDKFAAAARFVGRVIAAVFGTVFRIGSRVGLAILTAFVPLETVNGWWTSLQTTILNLFTGLKSYGGAALDWLGNAFKWYFATMLDNVKTVLTWLAKVPGVGKAAKIALEEIAKTEVAFKAEAAVKVASTSAPEAPAPESSAAAPRQLDVPAGGLRQSINRSRSTSYGDVYITPQKSPGPAELDEWMSLQHGT